MNQNRYDHGNPNKICDRCGVKYKASELEKQWDGLWVCSYDYESRQPQDTLRSRPDNQSVDAARPEGEDVFITVSVFDEAFPDGTYIVDGEGTYIVDGNGVFLVDGT